MAGTTCEALGTRDKSIVAIFFANLIEMAVEHFSGRRQGLGCTARDPNVTNASQHSIIKIVCKRPPFSSSPPLTKELQAVGD